MDGVFHLVFIHALDAPAEKPDAALRLVQLDICQLSLHRDKAASDLHIGKAQLRENVEPRNGAGDRDIIALAADRHIFLGSRGDDVRLHLQFRQDLAQPVHALAERVQKRQIHRRLRNFQRHARKARAAADVDHALRAEIRRVQNLREDELYEAAKQLAVPVELVQYVHENGRLPVVNFAAGGVATPADAALMMQLGAEGVFVGSGIFKSGDPAKRAAAIVKAVPNYTDAKLIAALSTDLGAAMVGLNESDIALLMAERGTSLWQPAL
mgnify:CR=1 FL=1